MEVWKTEDPHVNFEKRFAHYEIYTWTLCHSYLNEKQTSRIQSLKRFSHYFILLCWSLSIEGEMTPLRAAITEMLIWK